jgi:CHASE3 domain sensor protein
MSPQAQTYAGGLARRVKIFVFGLLLLGVLGAAALGYAAYRVYELNAQMSSYAPAASLYRVRTTVIHQLSDMETALHRFLLDGNSSSLNLMQRDKERIEQMAQEDPELQADKLLQSLVAKEQQWYQQVSPLIEERKNLPAGQGLSEDFVNHFRTLSPDLDVVSFEVRAEREYRQALEGMAQSERQSRLRFSVMSWFGAVLLIVFMIALTGAALRHLGGLR